MDAADLINGALKCGEFDHGIVLNRYAQQVLNGLHRQTRAAAGQVVALAQEIGGVDTVVLETGDFSPEITGDGEHARGLRHRIDGEKQHGVGTRGAFAFKPIAVVQAHQQDGDPVGAVPRFQLLPEDHPGRRGFRSRNLGLSRPAAGAEGRETPGIGPGSGEVPHRGVDQEP